MFLSNLLFFEISEQMFITANSSPPDVPLFFSYISFGYEGDICPILHILLSILRERCKIK
jgi:hypothetical protein